MCKKKWLNLLSCILACLLTASGVTITHAEQNQSRLDGAIVLYADSSVVLVDGKEKLIDPEDPTVTPVIENGQCLIPTRFVSENMGASVEWNSTARTISIRYQGKQILLTEGKKEITVNGRTTVMEAAAKNIGGRVFVPLRPLAEAMGNEAFYDRGLIIISGTKDIFDPSTDRSSLNELIAKVNNLPTLGDEATLIRYAGGQDTYAVDTADGSWLVRKERAGMDSDSFEYVTMEDSEADGAQLNAAAAPEAAAGASATSQATSADSGSNSGSAADYSTTNVQVKGVDEGDIIKTDGQYLYYVKNDEIAVIKATPADRMEVTSKITFGDDTFYPIEMYVDGNQIIVLGNGFHNLYASRTRMDMSISRSSISARQVTKAYFFDTSDKANIKKVRELESDGRFVSSRKIGKTLYFVSSISLYNLIRDGKYALPGYRDTAVKDEDISVDYSRIYYFPTVSEKNYTMVSSVRLDEISKPAQVYTYFGGGQNMYVSQDNMYVAAYDYRNHAAETHVYKFSLNNGQITYLYKGSVPGQVLNQFSMDEKDDYFRIATTGIDGQYQQTNQLYVLNEAMNIVGRIEDIAPGEKIYSVRFMGDRGYMVTFKTVDPLFVIDLKDPQKPKILGALKIPGYSDYLHPYDENHLIGFGKNTVVEYGNAIASGMKLSFFDVSDVSQPKELFNESIGGRGTDSPLLYNHRALLFDKEKNILAFPIERYAATGGTSYGGFEFQGAMVYSIDMSKGFIKKGSISHLDDEDLLKAAMYQSDGSKYIQRIVTIGDKFYTVSNQMVKANQIADLKEIGKVSIK